MCRGIIVAALHVSTMSKLFEEKTETETLHVNENSWNCQSQIRFNTDFTAHCRSRNGTFPAVQYDTVFTL